MYKTLKIFLKMIQVYWIKAKLFKAFLIIKTKLSQNGVNFWFRNNFTIFKVNDALNFTLNLNIFKRYIN